MWHICAKLVPGILMDDYNTIRMVLTNSLYDQNKKLASYQRLLLGINASKKPTILRKTVLYMTHQNITPKSKKSQITRSKHKIKLIPSLQPLHCGSTLVWPCKTNSELCFCGKELKRLMDAILPGKVGRPE